LLIILCIYIIINFFALLTDIIMLVGIPGNEGGGIKETTVGTIIRLKEVKVYHVLLYSMILPLLLIYTFIFCAYLILKQTIKLLRFPYVAFIKIMNITVFKVSQNK